LSNWFATPYSFFYPFRFNPSQDRFICVTRAPEPVAVRAVIWYFHIQPLNLAIEPLFDFLRGHLSNGLKFLASLKWKAVQ
jgi:hypothetical protein